MAKRRESRSDYFASVAVTGPTDTKVLGKENMWEILELIHSSPEGVRPKEVAEEFEIRLNQAYDKLSELEKQDYVKRKKERGTRGKEQERKTLLYLSSAWGYHYLEDDFEQIMDEKFGKYVIQKVSPVLIEYFKEVLNEMQKDKEFVQWLPSGSRWCPDCGFDHQAWELFRAVVAHATHVVESYSFEWYKNFLEHSFIRRKEFGEYTEKTKDAPDWAFTDSALA